MCKYCENMNDLLKIFPLIQFNHKQIAYLFNGNLHIEESKSKLKYNVKINYCPICGQKLTETKDNTIVKPIIHAHAIIDWLGNSKCSNCDEYVDANRPYCQHCGADLDEPIERRD